MSTTNSVYCILFYIFCRWSLWGLRDLRQLNNTQYNSVSLSCLISLDVVKMPCYVTQHVGTTGNCVECAIWSLLLLNAGVHFLLTLEDVQLDHVWDMADDGRQGEIPRLRHLQKANEKLTIRRPRMSAPVSSRLGQPSSVKSIRAIKLHYVKGTVLWTQWILCNQL